MLARKKEERRRRKRKDVDIINDNDDLIAHLIQQMKMASEVSSVISCHITRQVVPTKSFEIFLNILNFQLQEDRDSNKARKPAIKKISLLPTVVTQLRKT